MPEQFRKKPVVIEAVHWNGLNFDEVAAFVGGEHVMQVGSSLQVWNELHGSMVIVGELEWVAKGTRAGDFYPLHGEALEADFEPVDADA